MLWLDTFLETWTSELVQRSLEADRALTWYEDENISVMHVSDQSEEP
jgi:hypothetical protein